GSYAFVPYSAVVSAADSRWRLPHDKESDRSHGQEEVYMQVGSPAEQLRRQLRQDLSQQLSERIRTDEAGGRPPMSDAERRALAQKILADAAEAHTQAMLTHGRAVVKPEVEQFVIAGVLNEIFGLAGLDP